MSEGITNCAVCGKLIAFTGVTWFHLSGYPDPHWARPTQEADSDA
jgi:hypothetical protein